MQDRVDTKVFVPMIIQFYRELFKHISTFIASNFLVSIKSESNNYH